MADDYTVLPSDAANAGDKVDTSSLSVGGQTVIRQRVNLADPTLDVGLAKVRNGRPTSADYALAVREVPTLTDWAVTHAPAANTQAVASKAAGGAGVRHVCTGVSITLANGAAAPTAALVTVNLRDGASGAGSILCTWTLAVEATAGKVVNVSLPGLKVPGTANTAMTLETSAAPGANVSASVNLFGHSVTE